MRHFLYPLAAIVVVSAMMLACGRGSNEEPTLEAVQPTRQPTYTLTPTPTHTNTPVPPTDTPIPTATPTATDTPTPTETPVPTDTPVPPTDTPEPPTPTATPGATKKPKPPTSTPAPPTPTARNVLLEEDFESGADGWLAFTNYWRPNPDQWYLQGGDGYEGSTGIRHNMYLGANEAHDGVYMYLGEGAQEWTNYRFQARLRLEIGKVIGVWVRGKYFKDDRGSGRHLEGYYITYRETARPKSIELARMRTVGDTKFHFSDPKEILRAPYRMEFSRWYEFVVEVRGSNIKVIIDGEQVINHDDGTFGQGTVGFVTYQVEYGMWDDVLVEPLP